MSWLECSRGEKSCKISKHEFRNKCMSIKRNANKCKKKSKWLTRKIIFSSKQDMQENWPNRGKSFRKRKWKCSETLSRNASKKRKLSTDSMSPNWLSNKSIYRLISESKSNNLKTAIERLWQPQTPPSRPLKTVLTVSPSRTPTEPKMGPIISNTCPTLSTWTISP